MCPISVAWSCLCSQSEKTPSVKVTGSRLKWISTRPTTSIVREKRFESLHVEHVLRADAGEGAALHVVDLLAEGAVVGFGQLGSRARALSTTSMVVPSGDRQCWPARDGAGGGGRVAL